MKIGCVGWDDAARLFRGDDRVVVNSPINVTADMVFGGFWGGEDIWPGFYGQTAIHTDSTTKSRRDFQEQEIYKACLAKGIPMLGICRGAQFLCAMSGGELYQDVGHGHSGSHEIQTKDGPLIVTSTHHQMMSPQKVKHDLIGWCDNRCNSYFKEELEEKPEVDYEIVYFPHTQALCIQGHPEYLSPSHAFYQYTHKLINQYLLTNKVTML
jgi:gamma-glutamyl-gamma-aminobutyrate hydrolase PuuD